MAARASVQAQLWRSVHAKPSATGSSPLLLLQQSQSRDTFPFCLSFVTIPTPTDEARGALRGRRARRGALGHDLRSEEQTYELQSLMRTSYDVFCLEHKTQ